MITKKVIAPLLVVILISGIGGVLAAKKTADKKMVQSTMSAEETAAEVDATAPAQTESTGNSEAVPQAAPGRYTDYSDQARSDAAYQNTVLFFHAGWCPECRAYDQAIKSGAVPAGTQILKVDYDSSADLKKQHGVTLQSTFVSVDGQGNQRKKWVGYGKDKSLQTIFKNLGI